jgi:hypothetical protein
LGGLFDLGRITSAACKQFAPLPTPLRDAVKGAGILPRHKNSPPDCFCPGFAGAGLLNPIIAIKNTEAKASVFFMGWIMGFEPTTFRATI